jgi:ABC-type multidrug transport system fused ATPase/permease subunit
MQNRDETQRSFEAQLQTYRQNQIQLADGGIWKSPYMMLPTAVLSVFLMVVISIRFLDPSSRMHLAELMTLVAAVGLALAGFQRFLFALRRYRTAERAALSVANYLEQPTAVHTDRTWIALSGPRFEIVLDHVTFRNSTAQKLLEDITASVKPGMLTAVIASEAVQSSALVEMILGFGKPASGRILINGIDSTDVEPAQIRNLSLWVSPKGPLVNGTLEENLWAGAPHDATIDMMACAKRMRVSDPILNLPDGLSTIVTPNEDRLQPDDIFRIGLTRGLIKNPNLIVAHEPSNRVEQAVEEQTSAAIREIAAPNRMLVVLAQRLATLRDADQIIVLHEHRIAGIGTHAQLLENCEIYRHINYMMFSPF